MVQSPVDSHSLAHMYSRSHGWVCAAASVVHPNKLMMLAYLGVDAFKMNFKGNREAIPRRHHVGGNDGV